MKYAAVSCSALLLSLAGCATSPPVETSQQMLWQQFGGRSIDQLLLAWGAPMSETRLTDGTRLAVYTYTNAYDVGDYDENYYSCKATFLAPPPTYTVSRISLTGQAYECDQLAHGRIGVETYVYPHNTFYDGTIYDGRYY